MIKTLLLTTTMLASTLLSAQAGFSAAGGDVSGPIGSMSYSIGQIDFNYYSSSEFSINEGVQQPFEWFAVISVNEFSTESAISLYPNPTKGELLVSIKNTPGPVLVKVYDSLGKLIISNTLTSIQNRMDLSALSNGSYYAHFIGAEGKTNEIFKVVKTN